MTEQNDMELSAEEKAYFETGGENGLPDEVKAPEPQDGQPAPTIEPTEGDEPPALEGAKKDDEPRKVDYRALKEEREKRQMLEGQVQEMNRRFQIAEQRMAMMQQAMQPKPEQAAIPDPEEDVVAFAKWQREQFLTDQQRRQESEQQTRQRQANDQYWNRVAGTWASALRNTAAEDPEVEDSYNFLLMQRRAELRATGMSEQQAISQANLDSVMFAEQNMREGRHPVLALKQVAAARGWQPKPQVQTQQPADRLAAVNAAQAANKSLSPVGSGGNARGSLTARDLADMPDDEFAALLDQKGSKGFRSMMGG